LEPVLIGRETECARVDELLERARLGRSGALVVRGEAGIGKTALLDYAIERAVGTTVVRALGVESEAEIEFSGLLEVCRPLLEHLDEISAPQAGVLRSALDLGPAMDVDRFGIGAAILSLLAAAADARPLVIVVDDAQWLDPSSADALLFATRRLQADRVLVLFAAREGEERSFEASGIESLSLSGLSRKAAESLLQREGALVEEVGNRLYEATGGNPLALIELPGLLTADQLAGSAPLEDPLPAGASVERAFARRAQALPEGSQTALLVAAASTSAEIETVVAALVARDLDASSLEPAEDAGLLTLVDGRLVFRHPLVRSAVYQAAAPSERRAAHRALAEALAESTHDEARAWHLAGAALGPDEEAAVSLVAAATRARERNAHATAASAFERAARLTPDTARRLERLTQAAEAAWAGGDPTRALGLLDAADPIAEPASDRARLLHLRGRIERRVGMQSEALGRLLQAETLIRDEDPNEAAWILLHAVPMSSRAGDIPAAVELARRLRDVAPTNGTSLDAHAATTLGWILCQSGNFAEGRPWLERAAGLLLGRERPTWVELYLASLALRLLERTAEGIEVAERAGQLAREQGPTALLSALDLLTEWEVWTGRWGVAAAHGEEGLALARQVGHADQLLIMLTQLARVDAARGDAERCLERVDEAVRVAGDHGVETMRLAALGVAGDLELGIGRFDEAIDRLQLVSASVERLGIHDRDNSPHPDLVEALVRSGRREEAVAVADRFAERACLGTPLWGGALLARCRGLVADRDEDSAAHFGEAIALHEQVEDRFQHGRTLLVFGERLRRAGQRREARERLRDAEAIFDELEAEPWGDRARRELQASGERLRRRAAHDDEQLTPQELQIALQVAEGKTNKEVGAALFLSHKTVEFHLSRIYRKLDLNSRAELIRRFAAEGVPSLSSQNYGTSATRPRSGRL
jgi:DNA-binding CsgD family transcriptional regulator